MHHNPGVLQIMHIEDEAHRRLPALDGGSDGQSVGIMAHDGIEFSGTESSYHGVSKSSFPVCSPKQTSICHFSEPVTDDS